MVETMTEMRTCPKCGLEKELSEENFYFRKARGNFETSCKKCRNERTMSRRNADPERARKWKRDWYARNRFKLKQQRARKRAALTPEERRARAERRRQWDERRRQRRMEAYLAEHGEMPLCACGCGERVKFDSRGNPRTYAAQNHHMRVSAMREKVIKAHERRAEELDAIPIDKFRAAVRKVKEDRGWSWRQMAEAGGWNYNHIKSTMYDKRLKTINRKIGEDFFKRIQGIPTEPSKYMQRQAQRDMARLGNLEAQIDRIYSPREPTEVG